MDRSQNKIPYARYKDPLGHRLSRRSVWVGDCLEWTGSKNANGYGTMKWEGGSKLTHRLTWIAVHGSIPDGKDVLHTCDNRKCRNIDHLWIGDHEDNMADKKAKGRNRNGMLKGVGHGMVKLTEEQVISIRNDTRQLKEIAADYGIGKGNVWMIRHRKTWRHLP